MCSFFVFYGKVLEVGVGGGGGGQLKNVELILKTCYKTCVPQVKRAKPIVESKNWFDKAWDKINPKVFIPR